jgi:predicted TIM-barrel fold metal-dependent hydrolase
MKYNRISADCHLDLPWMPPDLFTSLAPRELKDRMPYVVETDEGPKWTAKNGATFGFKNGVGPAGSKYVKGKHHRVDVMAETGLYEDGARDVRRVSDPHLRIKDLDRDHVDAEVIYGILGAASRLNDKDAANEMLRIYNDWLKDFCSHYPDRHIGLACLPYGDIDAAVKEIYRVAKMGIRGLELSCSWDMEPMWHPMWEPLW